MPCTQSSTGSNLSSAFRIDVSHNDIHGPLVTWDGGGGGVLDCL